MFIFSFYYKCVKCVDKCYYKRNASNGRDLNNIVDIIQVISECVCVYFFHVMIMGQPMRHH